MERQGGTHPLTQGYGVFVHDQQLERRAAGGAWRPHAGREQLHVPVPDRRTGIFVAVTGDYGQTLPGGALLGLPAPPPPDKAQQGRTLPGLAQIRGDGAGSAAGAVSPADRGACHRVRSGPIMWASMLDSGGRCIR